MRWAKGGKGREERKKGRGRLSRRHGERRGDGRECRCKMTGASGLGSATSSPGGNTMHVQVSTDTRTTADIAGVTAAIEAGLSRYKERLNRVEVHLSDVNGP